MKTKAMIALGVTALVAGGMAQARPGDRLREYFAQRAGAAENNTPSVPASATIAYGPQPSQMLDFWSAHLPSDPAMVPAPLVIFVHGGGWQRGSKDNATGRWKAAHRGSAGAG